jgi:NAD-dependent deacetylase
VSEIGEQQGSLEAEAAKLASMILAAGNVVVLTGAGVSTESGIPDFRGPDGLWQNKTLEELAQIDTFHRDPALTWAFYRDRLHTLRGVQPNPGHLALAELERLGVVRGIITQNVDGLHTAAGSKLVLEMHGSLRVAVCPSCRREVDIHAAIEDVGPDRGRLPRCLLCPGRPVLKPGVVLFGEPMPPTIDEAHALLGDCDLLVVCGSSLQVFPVAGMPAIVRHNQGRVAIVNKGETGYPHAELTIDAPTGELLPLVVQQLASSLPA